MQFVTSYSPSGTFRVTVETDGVPLQMFPHGDDVWIPGVPGKSYVIAVSNASSGCFTEGCRLEVITSVDGRNTLADEEADLNANHGMVLRPGETYRFRGWRTDDDSTREFLFGDDPEDSVAMQASGSAAGAGVIGVAAWREVTPRFAPLRGGYIANDGMSVTYRSTASFGTAGASFGTADMNAPVAMAAACGEAGMGPSDLSTGIGKAQHDPVGHTTFRRTGRPDVLAVRYASYELLVSKGIIKPALPDPFPGGGTGYRKYRVPR